MPCILTCSFKQNKKYKYVDAWWRNLGCTPEKVKIEKKRKRFFREWVLLSFSGFKRFSGFFSFSISLKRVQPVDMYFLNLLQIHFAWGHVLLKSYVYCLNSPLYKINSLEAVRALLEIKTIKRICKNSSKRKRERSEIM